MLKKLKIALAVIVAIPVLFFGSALAYVLIHPVPVLPKATQVTPEPKVAGENTEAPSIAVPTKAPSVGVATETILNQTTPMPTSTQTPTPKPIIYTPTPKPTIYVSPTHSVVPTVAPVIQTGGSYACNCSKTCTQITTCAEAQYQLNVCGCRVRDNDHDGIACDGAPLHCQN